MPEELNIPMPHPVFEPIIGLFQELGATRASGMNGPMAIQYNEIKAYSDLMGVALSPAVIGMILRIDNAFIEAVNKLNE